MTSDLYRSGDVIAVAEANGWAVSEEDVDEHGFSGRLTFTKDDRALGCYVYAAEDGVAICTRGYMVASYGTPSLLMAELLARLMAGPGIAKAFVRRWPTSEGAITGVALLTTGLDDLLEEHVYAFTVERPAGPGGPIVLTPTGMRDIREAARGRNWGEVAQNSL